MSRNGAPAPSGWRYRSGLHVLTPLLPFVRPHWRGLLPAIAGVIGASLVGLLVPWPLKVLIDDVLRVGRPGAPLNALRLIVAIALAIIGIAVLSGLASYVKTFFIAATGQRVAFSLRCGLFEHLQGLPLAFHDGQRTGDLITRVTNDVTKVQETLTDDLAVKATTRVIQLIGMFAVILAIDWQVGLVGVAASPVIALTATRYRGRIRDEERRVREHEGDIASLTQESISSIRVVKAFGREGFQTRRFEEESGRMLEAGLEVTRLEGRYSWALNVVTAVGFAAFVSVGALRVLSGALSVGTLVVFIDYFRDLQSPMLSLSKMSAKVAKVRVRAERIVEVLGERPTPTTGGRKTGRLAGDVRFEGISFAYRAGEPVLRELTLRAAPGEVIGIVGATGAGKSTVISLLLRLYDPQTGRILVDGADVRSYRLESLIEQVAVVLQEPLLFQATIEENIAYGRPQASREEIAEASRLAYCDEFIGRLPNGIQTVVGERGATLSGGQRQRIAIARALVRDAPILLLDEPTAGLDAASEETVLRALGRLMRGRTTLFVTHRLFSVRHADRIYVLDGGRVVEEGTHGELVDHDGLYARAFRIQAATSDVCSSDTSVLRPGRYSTWLGADLGREPDPRPNLEYPARQPSGPRVDAGAAINAPRPERGAPMIHILLVEDDPRIREIVEQGLYPRGFAVTSVSDGLDAAQLACELAVDLVLLDFRLPGRGGLEVLEDLRRVKPTLPVIALTALDDVASKVRGLDAGADDYVTKPFSVEELAARIRARLRWVGGGSTSLRAGPLTLDLSAHRAVFSGQEVPLSARELELLATFMRHPGQVLTRQQLLEMVWELDFDPGSNVVDVYVSALRRKIGAGMIETVRSLGYRFVVPANDVSPQVAAG
ncbi:MAG: ABC transporter transmembrane domain-containing protein [Actinomycetota bacterium]|nr:ABC transporter transmembrane domain-containing protein [Actinomycetota bacterium]